MDVIANLIAGHRELGEQRDLVRKLAHNIDNVAFFWDNALAVKRFFDTEVKEHFRLEENVLFPLLRKRVPSAAGEIDRIEKYHPIILQKLDDFEKIAQYHNRYSSKVTLEYLIKTAGAILDMLLAHARDEDEGIFPLVKAHFTPDDYRELEERYKAEHKGSADA